jgi:glycosyltransferase involved in cell wall biosynthesis
MQNCKAFLFPGLEDFGIAPVEAMAAGRPVVAFAGGGALDTVLPGITGETFGDQSAAGLAQALARFDPAAYDPAACRAQAERFSTAAFQAALTGYVGQVLAAGPRPLSPHTVEPARPDLSETVR